MAYYENASQYIEDFDINAPIVDTEERDKMCEMWEELAYSKIYLMSLCYDEEDKMYHWYKDEVYWTGWEWNEENNHIHGIGTIRNLYNEDEQQKNHMVFDRHFNFIISEKRLKNMHSELKTYEYENSEKNDETYPRKIDLGICINNMITFGRWREDDMKIAYILNEGKIPGKLDIQFPKIDDV